MTPRYNITIIGAGNVGYHLSQLFFEAGHTIVDVFDRNIVNAEGAANTANAKPISNLAEINYDADIFFLCVKDEMIGEIFSKLKAQNLIVVHTSGTTSIDVFKNFATSFGVFYPVQSFSKKIKTSLRNVTIGIDGNSDETKNTLWNLAESLQAKPILLNDDRRQVVHLAAVVANNFTNHLFVIAQNILEQENLSFDLLKPLIETTVRKTDLNNPIELQTGPAMRNDISTMEKQLSFLNEHPQWEEIYRLISESIQETKNLTK